MANKKHTICLPEADRSQILDLLRKGSHSARMLTRARALLWAETYTDTEIAEGLGISRGTVENVRRRYVQGGLQAVLQEKARSGRPPKLTPEERAKITALACSNPPEGRARWTLNLLAEHAVSLELVETLSRDAVHRILKKTN